MNNIDETTPSSPSSLSSLNTRGGGTQEGGEVDMDDDEIDQMVDDLINGFLQVVLNRSHWAVGRILALVFGPRTEWE